jgi:hypothetical protein
MNRRLAGVGSAVALLVAVAACSAPHVAGHRSVAPHVSARQADAIRQNMHCDRHRHQPIVLALSAAARRPASGRIRPSR